MFPSRRWSVVERAIARSLRSSLHSYDVLVVSGPDPVLYVQFLCDGGLIASEVSDPVFQGAPMLRPDQVRAILGLHYHAPVADDSMYNFHLESHDPSLVARLAVGALKVLGVPHDLLVYSNPVGTEFPHMDFAGITRVVPRHPDDAGDNP